MNNFILSLVLLIGIGSPALAQSKSNKELKGDKFYSIYAFDKAIRAYSAASTLSLSGQRRLADSYHNRNMNTNAEVVYGTLINSGSEGLLAEDYYNYAMVLKQNGSNVESDKQMEHFSQLKPDDLRSKSFQANKGNYTNLSTDNGFYKINNPASNTKEQDFGTSYFQDKIVFASNRARPKWLKRKSNWDGEPYLNLYVSELKNGEMQKPEMFAKSLNGKMHDGPASFFNKGTEMAFTRNNDRDRSADKMMELQVYFSKLVDGKWSKPEAFMLNNPAYSVGHPNVSEDGKTMYFTCDMPGGFGGSDLYRTQKDASGNWSKPENLGDKINTEGDEMFPFVETEKNVLYFSSNGHFGLGGLDVFTVSLSQAPIVTNMGYPVNTKFDDFAAMAKPSTTKGYFSSNRVGGSGSDDIYTYTVLKEAEKARQLEGISKNENGVLVPNAFITLLDNEGYVLDTLTSQADGSFKFAVVKDKRYKLTGDKADYQSGTTYTSSFGEEEIILADVVLLTEKDSISPTILVNEDLAKVLLLDPIFFDYDRYNIRPDAADELDKIVRIMNKNKSMEVELGAHTDCRGTAEYNMMLSDFRAKSSINYIQSRISKPNRISGKGYGESKLMNGCACEGDQVSDCSSEMQQQNRRTEFIVTKK